MDAVAVAPQAHVGPAALDALSGDRRPRLTLPAGKVPRALREVCARHDREQAVGPAHDLARACRVDHRQRAELTSKRVDGKALSDADDRRDVRDDVEVRFAADQATGRHVVNLSQVVPVGQAQVSTSRVAVWKGDVVEAEMRDVRVVVELDGVGVMSPILRPQGRARLPYLLARDLAAVRAISTRHEVVPPSHEAPRGRTAGELLPQGSSHGGDA